MKHHILLGVAILISSMAFPQLEVFYKLQHERNGLYTMGPLDLYLTFFLTNLWLALRSVIMSLNFGIGSKELRFKEQFYQGIMYISTFTYALYNYLHSDIREDWIKCVEGYPHIDVTSHVKIYYLLIMSMWIHMVFSLYAEQRRSDHYLMLLHHCVTITLIVISWFTGMNKIGLLIEMVFDSTDILLCVAKCVKYTKRNKLADFIFALFVLNWMYTRQYLFSKIIWTLLQMPRFHDFAWDPKNGKLFTHPYYYFCVILLCTLFMMSMVWFGMILKLLIKLYNGNNVDDIRSDDEESDDEKQKNK